MEKAPGSGRGQDTRTALPSLEDLPATLPEDLPDALPEDWPAALMPLQICVYYPATGPLYVGRRALTSLG